MMNYEAMAKEFCKNTETKVNIKFKEQRFNPWNESDYRKNWVHNIYRVTIKRNGKQFSFDFTDSKHNTDNGILPTEYDVLACLTKYEVGNFEEFCSEFGYDVWAEYPEDATKEGYNKENYKTWKAVTKEYNNVIRLFGDVMEDLAEIA